jgi:glycosyltransferase involved in cell wall biosynthesis
MRILMVTSSYPKHPGDVTAPFIESIARGVAARGHAVDVVLPEHPDLRRGEREPVTFFPFRYAPTAAWTLWGYAQSLEADVRVRSEIYLLAPFVALALRNVVSRRLTAARYDAVHVHWVVPNAAMVSDVVRAHAVPLVVSLHGSDVFLAERSAVAGRLAARAFAAAGSVTACSGDLRGRAVALGAPPERTRTVPYGVDTAAFAPGDSDDALRARLGVPPGAIFVLGFGRMVEKKGFRFLVEAATRVPGVHVVMAGEGDLRGALETKARETGAPVSFPGGLDRATIAAALATADVVVVPSIVDSAGNVDGLPNALLEALAAGRAVVASRVAGIPDVVEDGGNGLLVPPKDVGALAAALGRLTAEPETRRLLGAEARRRAVRELSWDGAAQAFEECYAQAATLDAR